MLWLKGSINLEPGYICLLHWCRISASYWRLFFFFFFDPPGILSRWPISFSLPWVGVGFLQRIFHEGGSFFMDLHFGRDGSSGFWPSVDTQSHLASL